MITKNTRRSVELLKTLRPKQQAALLVEALAEANTGECELIRSAVERRTYTTTHAVFDDWHSAMRRLGLIVAAEVWRQCFMYSQGVAELNGMCRDLQDTPDCAELKDRINKTSVELDRRMRATNAMLKALETVCTENAFDYEAVLRASAPGNLADLTVGEHDQDTYATWLDCLRSMLPSYQPHQNIRDEPAA